MSRALTRSRVPGVRFTTSWAVPVRPAQPSVVPLTVPERTAPSERTKVAVPDRGPGHGHVRFASTLIWPRPSCPFVAYFAMAFHGAGPVPSGTQRETPPSAPPVTGNVVDAFAG